MSILTYLSFSSNLITLNNINSMFLKCPFYCQEYRKFILPNKSRCQRILAPEYYSKSFSLNPFDFKYNFIIPRINKIQTALNTAIIIES